MNTADDSTCIARSQHDREIVKRKTGFFDLPPEIRAIIIRAILGDGKVHVHYPQNVYTGIHVARFSFCDRKIPQKDAHRPNIDIPSRSYVKAHSSCYARPGCTLQQCLIGLLWLRSYPREVDGPDQHFERDLSLMAVSKQLREEAIQAFYFTNIFSIADSTSFKLFMARILPGRAHLIKKLELSTTMDAARWNKELVDTYGELAAEWNLNRDQQDKLRNVSDATIQLCDKERNGFPPAEVRVLRAHRAKHMRLTLRTAFSSLGNLKSLSRVDVHICCEPRAVFRLSPVQAAARQPDMDEGEMQEIGRHFAEEILNRDGNQQG